MECADDIKIYEGQEFSSYDEFETVFKQWCPLQNHPMNESNSTKNASEIDIGKFP